MSNEVIMLSTTLKKDKQLIFPCAAYEKLDGAPGDFYHDGAEVVGRTRQGEKLLSCEHICQHLHRLRLLPPKHHVIGELYIEGLDFKDISGIVRRKKPDEDTRKLKLHIFDYYVEGQEHMPYKARMELMADNLIQALPKRNEALQLIPGKMLKSLDDYHNFVAKFKKDKPHSEGIVIRALTGDKAGFKAAWRSPGMLKLKWTETVDVPIVSIEEAIDKDGTPKGMVGRINVMYNGKVSGVGPGKMTHDVRVTVFQNQKDYIGKTIEVAHMPDDSYEGLREGRFYRFRPDKD